MDLTERLAAANRRSVVAYQRRQALQMQLQQVQQAIGQTEMELVKLDGEIACLEALIRG